MHEFIGVSKLFSDTKDSPRGGKHLKAQIGNRVSCKFVIEYKPSKILSVALATSKPSALMTYRIHGRTSRGETLDESTDSNRRESLFDDVVVGPKVEFPVE